MSSVEIHRGHNNRFVLRGASGEHSVQIQAGVAACFDRIVAHAKGFCEENGVTLRARHLPIVAAATIQPPDGRGNALGYTLIAVEADPDEAQEWADAMDDGRAIVEGLKV